MTHTLEIPFYEPHAGTVRISGSTVSTKAASCALNYLNQDVGNIDFFYIGANAGQQAMKAMGIFRYTVERITEGKTTIIFQPNRVRTKTPARDGQPENVVDAVYWRAYPIRTAHLEELYHASRNNPNSDQQRSG